jgi:ADP-ribose pyrophosphatase
VPARTSLGGELIEVLRVPIEAAVAALNSATLRNGPLLLALQWLALNRARLPALLNSAR